jgi:hypothetical protein
VAAYTLVECGPVCFSRAVEHPAGHVVHTGTRYHVMIARDAKNVGVSRSTDFNIMRATLSRAQAQTARTHVLRRTLYEERFYSFSLYFWFLVLFVDVLI